MTAFWGMLWPALLQGAAAALLALPLAIAAGWGLMRADRRWLIAGICLLPLLLSPVLVGYVAAQLFSGVLFRTPFAMLVGQILVIMPWMSLICWQYFNRQPRHALQLANSLGLSPKDIFWQMRVPAAAPGLGLALVVGMCQSLTDLGLALLLGGNIPGHSQTPALMMYQRINSPESGIGLLPLSGVMLVCGLISLMIVCSLMLPRKQS